MSRSDADLSEENGSLPSGHTARLRRSTRPDGTEEWFERWFDERYLLVYGHHDQREAEAFVTGWTFWNELPQGGWCLDLGCGEGRYARAIARGGLKVVGLDLSKALLKRAIAEEKVDPSLRNNPVGYVRADMRSLPFIGIRSKKNPPLLPPYFVGGEEMGDDNQSYWKGFDLVVSMFSSFGYFSSEYQDSSVLFDLGRLIKRDGWLILDLANPPAVRNAVAADPVTDREIGKSRITERRSIDPDARRVLKSIQFEEEGRSMYFQESVRLYEPEEILEMTRIAGFKPDRGLLGDYQFQELTPDSPRMIYIGRKR